VREEPERLREYVEGRRVQKGGVGRMPSSECGDVEEGGVGRMPSSERPGEKKGGASERLTGKEGEEGEEGGRRGEGVV